MRIEQHPSGTWFATGSLGGVALLSPGRTREDAKRGYLELLRRRLRLTRGAAL